MAIMKLAKTKKTMFAVVALLTIFTTPLLAEDFLGVPVVPGSEVVDRTEDRVEMKTAMSRDEIVDFYEGLLKDHKDIKTIEREETTQITDYGNLKWHSIAVSKKKLEGKTTVIIKKDSWSWIFGTLVLRYIGVFAVIIMLFICMSITGAVISRSVKRIEAKKAADGTGTHEQEMVAVALAAAKDLENRKSGKH
jgi:Na+-transporting methylmalonyl-CoA/oxaloacetate decarboxylase gamma subunit